MGSAVAQELFLQSVQNQYHRQGIWRQYQNLELMILHHLRFITKFIPALVVIDFTDGVSVVHLASLLELAGNAFAAQPALGYVAVTKLMEELSFEIFLESGIAVVAETEKILVLVRAVEVWAASFVRSSSQGVSARSLR